MYSNSPKVGLHFRTGDNTLFAAAGGTFFWLEVNASGVKIKRSVPTSFSNDWNGPFAWRGNMFVSPSGRVFDIEKATVTGQIPYPQEPYIPVVAPDAQGSSVLALEGDGYSASLIKYSLSSFLPIARAELDVSPLHLCGSEASMRSWGSDGVVVQCGVHFLIFHSSEMGAIAAAPPTPTRERTGIIRLPFRSGGLEYDPARRVLWASVPGKVSSIGNSVIAIDPGSGEILETIFVGSEPGALALSGDGSRLFTALLGAPFVVPVDLVRKTALTPFTILDTRDSNNDYWVGLSLLAAPGDGSGVTVLRTSGQPSDYRSSVVVYDGAVQRARAFTKTVDCLVPAEAPGLMYAANLTITLGDGRRGLYGSELFRLAVEPDGVALAKQVNPIPLREDSNPSPRSFAYSNGALFTSVGRMWTADVEQQLGSFDVGGIPVSLPEKNQIAYVRTDALANPVDVTVFDLTTFRPVATLPTSLNPPDANAVRGAVRVGPDAIAYFSERETVLVPLASLMPWPSVPQVAQEVAPGVRRLNIPVNALTVLPGSSKLLLATPSSAGELGNSIVTLDPESGRIEGSTFAGSEPTILSPAPDGTGVWAYLSGEYRIAKINPGGGRDLAFTPDIEGGNTQHGVHDMVAGPDGGLAVSYQGSWIAVFDNGKPRPTFDHNTEMLPDGVAASAYSLTFRGTENILYGYNDGLSSFDLRRLRVSRDGATWLSTAADLIDGYHTKLHYAGGLLYASTGKVTDPERSRIVGRFALPPWEGWEVLPDLESGRVYLITSNGLLVYDAHDYSLIGSLSLSLPDWPGWASYPWGARSAVSKVGDQIAFRANKALFLIKTSEIPMLSVPVPSPQISLPSTPDVAVVDLATEDLAYDPLRDRIYASVPKKEAALGDHIAVIQPAPAQVIAMYPAGSNPRLLALSDDQSQLHYTMGVVAYPNPALVSEGVRTLNLNNQTIGPKFGEKAPVSYGYYWITALAALPGQTGSLALAYMGYEKAADGQPVLVQTAVKGPRLFDGVTARPKTPDADCFYMQAGATASRLYCAHWNSFSRIAVNGEGATLLSTSPMAYEYGYYQGQILFSGGRIYTTDGLVFDAETMQKLGSARVLGPVAIEGGRAYWLDSTGGPDGTVALKSFDAVTMEPITTKLINVASKDVRRLISCGQGRLAFNAGNQLYIVYPRRQFRPRFRRLSSPDHRP
jgi:DNA-binding beta-propeller fold protein YncE